MRLQKIIDRVILTCFKENQLKEKRGYTGHILCFFHPDTPLRLFNTNRVISRVAVQALQAVERTVKAEKRGRIVEIKKNSYICTLIEIEILQFALYICLRSCSPDTSCGNIRTIIDKRLLLS